MPTIEEDINRRQLLGNLLMPVMNLLVYTFNIIKNFVTIY